ncbi:MAG TPA: DUF3866 family protein [Solirubrobacterales bacterium]|nr:DUF3866 family protein [Solirubrobacterales bacterium]
MSGRLKLRRGVIVAEEPLTVEVDGERRRAWADEALLGEMREGDEVVVNVEALDLGLGSGGFDVVHVNLTRGLTGGGPPRDEHVMKLNYSSLQHAVEPTESAVESAENVVEPAGRCNVFRSPEHRKTLHRNPALVIPLHGHLAPATWAAAQTAPGLRVGFVQTGGGALPGSLGRDVAELRERGLLCGHLTAGPAYGGEHEAISVAGGIDAAVSALGWDAVIIGPGPGILGSESRLGHGGLAALDNAHAALALGLPTLLSPRLSSADPRERHRPVSHHTLTVLGMLLAPIRIPLPSGNPDVVEVFSRVGAGPGGSEETWAHRLLEVPADIAGYATADLPSRTMGRTIAEDPLFFAAALASGRALGEAVAGGSLRGKG